MGVEMKNLFFIAFLSILLLLNIDPGLCSENQKLAQTGMKFLSISTDARASAMADAVTALEGGSANMFYNPSAMARVDKLFNISFGQITWIAEMKQMYGTVAFNPALGKYGVFGLSMMSMDYGDFNGTIIADNDQGFIETGNFSPDAMVLGIGYAIALTDKFSVGGNVKYVSQSLGSVVVSYDQDGGFIKEDNETNVAAFDFGVLYHTGFKSLNFGMNVRNFSREIKFLEESFQLPLTFKVGLSMNLLDLYNIAPEKHTLFLATDASHPRDYSEKVNVGMEYIFSNMLALRAGYSTPNDEYGFSAGVGVSKSFSGFDLTFDYAYTPYDAFEDVQRISVHFSF